MPDADYGVLVRALTAVVTSETHRIGACPLRNGASEHLLDLNRFDHLYCAVTGVD